MRYYKQPLGHTITHTHVGMATTNDIVPNSTVTESDYMTSVTTTATSSINGMNYKHTCTYLLSVSIIYHDLRL